MSSSAILKRLGSVGEGAVHGRVHRGAREARRGLLRHRGERRAVRADRRQGDRGSGPRVRVRAVAVVVPRSRPQRRGERVRRERDAAAAGAVVGDRAAARRLALRHPGRRPPPNRPPAGREGRLADDRHPARRRDRAARRPGTDPRARSTPTDTRSRCSAAPARRSPIRAGARSSSSSTGRRPTATARSVPCSRRRASIRAGSQERTSSKRYPDPAKRPDVYWVFTRERLNRSRRRPGWLQLPLELLDPPAQLEVPLLGELDRVAVAVDALPAAGRVVRRDRVGRAGPGSSGRRARPGAASPPGSPASSVSRKRGPVPCLS